MSLVIRGNHTKSSKLRGQLLVKDGGVEGTVEIFLKNTLIING